MMCQLSTIHFVTDRQMTMADRTACSRICEDFWNEWLCL